MFDADVVQLIIDVGNTRMKFAILEQFWADDPCALEKLPRCFGSFVYEANEPVQWETIEQFIQEGRSMWVRSLICGSHPQKMDQLAQDWPTHLPPPRVIQNVSELPIQLDVNTPEKVGLDRIMNVMAANRLRDPAHWAIIVDTGTATTIDVVCTEGTFQGGAILPGYELAAHSLHDYTQLLPLISMEEILQAHPTVIGRDTNQAVRSGLIWGQVGAVNEIVSRMATNLSETTKAQGEFYLTGGAAPLLAPHLNHPFQHHPQLTLQGLGALE